MRIREALCLLALAGCGRVAFDEGSPDAPAPEHDEDRDGIGDSVDNCPHIANADQSNDDGDGAGNPCDPNPGIPGESIVFFEPFLDMSRWSSHLSASATSDGESVIADSRAGGEFYAVAPIALAHDRIVAGGRIDAQDATVIRQVTVAVQQDELAFYYCELFERDVPAPVLKFGLVHTPDNFLFNTVDNSTPTASLENRDFTLSITTPPTAATCETDWPADRQMLAGPTPAITTAQIELYAQGLQTRFDWVVVIRSP